MRTDGPDVPVTRAGWLRSVAVLGRQTGHPFGKAQDWWPPPRRGG